MVADESTNVPLLFYRLAAVSGTGAGRARRLQAFVRQVVDTSLID
jgi:hypothetical protein